MYKKFLDCVNPIDPFIFPFVVLGNKTDLKNRAVSLNFPLIRAFVINS